MKYAYEITGSAADRQTWFVEGEVEVGPTNFMGTPTMAIGDAFRRLTHGDAVYGMPGKGCAGPYKITRLLIWEKEDPQCR